jgi:hypothetical protein
MERNEGRWKRPGEPKKEQGRGQKESKERQPLPGHGEGQDEPADLNVSSANTVNSESPEAALKDESPVKKKPRRRYGAACTGVLVYGDEDPDEVPIESENKNL